MDDHEFLRRASIYRKFLHAGWGRRVACPSEAFRFANLRARAFYSRAFTNGNTNRNLFANFIIRMRGRETKRFESVAKKSFLFARRCMPWFSSLGWQVLVRLIHLFPFLTLARRSQVKIWNGQSATIQYLFPPYLRRAKRGR